MRLSFAEIENPKSTYHSSFHPIEQRHKSRFGFVQRKLNVIADVCESAFDVAHSNKFTTTKRKQ